MTDIDYAAVFGVSVKEQEVAEPAEAENIDGNGAKEQEVAEPVVDEVEEQEENNGEEPGPEAVEEEPTPEDKKSQPLEKRAEYAAARRKAEMEAEIERRVAEQLQSELDKAVAKMGIEVDGKKIKTKAEYEEYLARKTEQDFEEKLSYMGIDRKVFDELIQNNPVVRQAAEAAKKAEAAELALAQEKAKAALDAEFVEIKKLDPSITDMDALASRPEWPKIYARLKDGKNKSILDAFKLENETLLTQKAEAAAKQAAINTAGKQHMAATAARGSALPTVPPAVMANYRIFMPDATDAEIQKHWAREQKK